MFKEKPGHLLSRDFSVTEGWGFLLPKTAAAKPLRPKVHATELHTGGKPLRMRLDKLLGNKRLIQAAMLVMPVPYVTA